MGVRRLDGLGRARLGSGHVAHRPLRAARGPRVGEVPAVGRGRSRRTGRPEAPDRRDAREKRSTSRAATSSSASSARSSRCSRDLAGDPDADDLRARRCVRSGAVREAERAAASAAAERLAAGAGPRPAPPRTPASSPRSATTATPFGAGSRPPLARERLAQAATEAPRLLDAGKALVEVLHHLRADARGARRAAPPRDRLNPNLLAPRRPVPDAPRGAPSTRTSEDRDGLALDLDCGGVRDRVGDRRSRRATASRGSSHRS